MQELTKDDIKAAKENGISYGALYHRVYMRDWDIDRAVTEPLHDPKLDRTSKNQKWYDLGAKNGIPRRLVWLRHYNGWSWEKAATDPVRPYNKRSVQA